MEEEPGEFLQKGDNVNDQEDYDDLNDETFGGGGGEKSLSNGTNNIFICLRHVF